MSAERGSLQPVVAEGLSRALEASSSAALSQVRAGLGGALGALQGLRLEAEQLTGSVSWDDSADSPWWATRSGELICVGGPGDFCLTLTPQAISVGDLLVAGAPEGELLVGQGEESWVVRADGTVLAGEAVEQALDRSSDQLERGLEKLGQWSGARAPAPIPDAGSWMTELLGDLAPAATLATLVAPLARVVSSQSPPVAEARQDQCPECSATLPPQARFCPGCGHRVLVHPEACPVCHAPAPPDARFCAQCGQRLG